jgi:hypothetical protein
MLIPRGKWTYRNLNTTYTHIDQFVDGLQKEQFTGYCTVSFWEYDGVLFFVGGKILNGLEEKGLRGATVQIGDTAVANILAKGHEKDGEINAYLLPAKRVTMLVTPLNATTKYENLSTDLTSLDKLTALLKKETLSGYIEILLENEAGTANLLFVDGEIVESIFAPLDNRMIADPMSIEEIADLCQKNGAVFNVYQSNSLSAAQNQENILQGAVSDEAIQLFEAILIHLESTTDDLVKARTFQTVFKNVLPRIADTYEFLDPFIGDFRYVKRSLSYTGDASCKEFVAGMCDLINSLVMSLLETVSRDTFLKQISTALEPVSTKYSDLIEQLQLEAQIPEVFQDYSFIKENDTGEKGGKEAEARSVLNLQGVGVPEIASDSILREFYRVISVIVKKHCSAGGDVVEYGALKKSPEFQQYQTATALLQNFDISFLKSRDEALAFWLNLYNFLVIDGILKFGVNTSVQQSKGFFTKTSYRLGEYVFSLDDIEHGILRNNQRRPYSFFRPFSGSDPRKAFCFDPPDNRIHCCFACGTKSSPALTIYTPNQLNNQLNQAVNRFLTSEKGMRIDQKSNEIWLNRIFYWYRKDFEQKGETLIHFVADILQDNAMKQFISQNQAKLTLRFMDYDWSLNG